MMKNLYLTMLSVCFAGILQAQNPYCDGTRYYSKIFNSTTVTSGVQFGTNITVGGATKNLMMDIYEPVGDTALLRPVLFVGFGGSFVGGSRTSSDVVLLCRDFAKRGYVTVAYDYRLYDGPFIPLPDSIVMGDEVVRAVGDARAAIRWIRNSARGNNPYRVDSNFVFISGISAGAILGMHAAYMDDINEAPPFIQNFINANGGMEGNSNNIVASSSIQGVLSCSGALYRAAFADANDPPFVGIHDTGDNVVPYGFGNASVYGFPIITMQGDNYVHNRLSSLGVESHMITVNQSGHVAYWGNQQWMDSLENTSARMFQGILCDAQVGTFEPVANTMDAMNAYPNPTQNTLSIDFADFSVGEYNVTLMDATGRTVAQVLHQTETQTILPRGNWNNGIYFLTIQFADAAIKPIYRKIIYR